jgi:2-polyprenyl-6-methoxyphenol hydroxylase-like FAD-dependent oxidoreductase
MTRARERHWDVIVVGSGIGGLTAALALRRTGRRVLVLERRARPGAIGAGIALFPNALAALDAIALADAVRQVGHSPLHRSAGSPVGASIEGGLRLPSGRWLARVSGIEAFGRLTTFHRNELHAVLLEALPDGVVRAAADVLEVTDPCAGTEPGTDDAPVTVAVRTQDGDEELSADVVVGADGAGSRLRHALWPDHPGLTYAGYTAWRGVTAPGVRVDAAGETWGRGCRFGIVPLSRDRYYWFATANQPAGSTEGGTPSAEHDDLLRRFGHWHPPIRQLLEATEPDEVLRHDVQLVDPPLPAYVRGRVVLLGDAAHAMTPDLGQGACQAIEDAVTLAACLAVPQDSNGDGWSSAARLAAGLRDYDARRRPRTQQIAAAARRIGRFAQLDAPLAVAARSAALWLTPSALGRRGIDRVIAWTPPAVPAAVATPITAEGGLLDPHRDRPSTAP